MSKRAWIVVLLVLLGLAAGMYCNFFNDERAVVNIAVQARARSAPIYIAAEKNYFRDEGLDVVLQPITVGGQGVEMLVDGTADFIVGSGMPVLYAAQQSKDLSILAAIGSSDRDTGILFARTSPNSDLRGKRIGYTPGTTSELYLIAKLRSHGIARSDVVMVPLEPADFEAAVLNGRVDAASLWEPALTELRNKLGPHAQAINSDAGFFDNWLLLSKRRYGEATDVEKRLIRALVRANAFLQSDPEVSLKLAQKYISVSSDQWLGHYFDIQLDESVQYSLKGNARLTNIPIEDTAWAGLFRPEPIQAVVPWALGIEESASK